MHNKSLWGSWHTQADSLHNSIVIPVAHPPPSPPTPSPSRPAAVTILLLLRCCWDQPALSSLCCVKLPCQRDFLLQETFDSTVRRWTTVHLDEHISNRWCNSTERCRRISSLFLQGKMSSYTVVTVNWDCRSTGHVEITAGRRGWGLSRHSKLRNGSISLTWTDGDAS